MNIYLKIPSSRTYYYAKNVTQEIADENKYVKYLIKKKKEISLSKKNYKKRNIYIL